MLIGCSVGVGDGVIVGVWVKVGIALDVGVVEEVGLMVGLVAWTVAFSVTCSSCGSSAADPEQADVRVTRIKVDNHKARDLRIIRMMDTYKNCGSEI
jgi:hypothetical protein